MKSRRYKTHGQLDIPFNVHVALCGIMTMARNGLLKQWRRGVPAGNNHVLNMSVPMSTREECGSVGCIGGHVALAIGHRNPTEYVYSFDTRHLVAASSDDKDAMRPINLLYFPCQWEKNWGPNNRGAWVARNGGEWDQFTPEQIANAIENFLRGARNPWDGV